MAPNNSADRKARQRSKRPPNESNKQRQGQQQPDADGQPAEPTVGQDDLIIEQEIHRRERRGQPEALGLQIDESAIVTKVQDDGPCANAVLIGDRITHVDGQPLQPQSSKSKIGQFNALVAAANATITFRLVRPGQQAEDLGDWEKYIDRHAGFSYLPVLIVIPEKRGMALGLHIREIMNHVLVTKQPEPNTLVAKLKLCDRILEVDGAKVTSREVAKTLIKSRLSKNARVTLIIERPIEEGTYNTVLNLLENDKEPGGVPLHQMLLPVDLVSIVHAQLRRVKTHPAGVCPDAGTPIYATAERDEQDPMKTARPSSKTDLKTVRISGVAPESIEIVSDIKPSKKLRKVTRKF